jgi:hypothetical protein
MKALAMSRLAIAALALYGSLAHAGGPLSVCASAAVKYPGAGTVNLNYDLGPLGTRTKAQADAIVVTASAMWTNSTTATVTLGRGADLPVDVTTANYTTYYNVFNDHLNPVIYDTDGSIIDLVLGTGASGSVLGFAGSEFSGPPTCTYVEGQAVINGKIAVSDATITIVLAHELGHLIGMDHTQLDSVQGLASSNYPLMYPIAFRTLQSLGDDDASAISAIYPGPTVSTTYGTLSGNFRLADGVTPVLGANIWAKENTSGRVFSCVSDYLLQNSGFFKMLLLPGTYTLHAEAIDSMFDGGSSVGPYSDVFPSSPSFQAPLYSGSTPMPALTMGNGTPTQIAIVAGCAANADFRFSGTGSISGNCGAVTPPANPPRLANISTRGQVLTGNNVMIAGFIIGGSTAKTVVINVAGPSLANFGITDPLANPTLTLVRSSDNSIIASNDDWQTQTNPADVSSIQASGFQPSNALEPAIIATLAPGAYTAIVQGAGGGTGVGLVGVFEVDHPEIPLINISTRGEVLTANDVMIAGFIVQGTGPQTVVINVAGPSLANFGITNPLANPTLQLVRSSDQAVLATNDNWQSAPNAAAIQASGFAPSNTLEPAIMMTLLPGAYTAIVSGVGGGTGVGLVGVFTTP